MKRAFLLSLVLLFAVVVLAPAQAQSPAPAPALTAPISPISLPVFLTATAEPTWDPSLLATPQWALSLDPLAGALAATCAPVCAGCPAPCLKSNCHKEGLCLHCC